MATRESNWLFKKEVSIYSKWRPPLVYHIHIHLLSKLQLSGGSSCHGLVYSVWMFFFPDQFTYRFRANDKEPLFPPTYSAADIDIAAIKTFSLHDIFLEN